MHPVPRIDFGSELIGNSLVAHRDEGSTPVLRCGTQRVGGTRL